jgi:hypothetical protein
MKTPFNKFIYLGFIALGGYQVFLGDYLTAASSLGIALAFDSPSSLQFKKSELTFRHWLKEVRSPKSLLFLKY